MPMNKDPAPILRERLGRLASFLPAFEAPGFRFGEWSAPESTAPGVVVLPGYCTGETASLFVQAAYESGWVLTDFNWSAWASTPEAGTLRDDPEALAGATAEQLANLLTVIIRGDRFCEGSLASCFQSGLLVGILRRADTLRSRLS